MLRRYPTLVLLLGLLLSARGPSDTGSSPATGTASDGKSALACEDLETLRASWEDLTVATNPRTGNALEYAVRNRLKRGYSSASTMNLLARSDNDGPFCPFLSVHGS